MACAINGLGDRYLVAWNRLRSIAVDDFGISSLEGELSISAGRGLMGSFSRRVGGIAGAAVIGAGLTALSSEAYVMHGLPVAVPCTTPALVAAIRAANAVRARTLTPAASCNYVLTASAENGARGPTDCCTAHVIGWSILIT
jgi:hypothetical protein